MKYFVKPQQLEMLENGSDQQLNANIHYSCVTIRREKHFFSSNGKKSTNFFALNSVKLP